MMAAKIAALLEEQKFIPIVALISPKKKWRNEARELFTTSFLIYVAGGTLWKDTSYEEPANGELVFTYDWRQ